MLKGFPRLLHFLQLQVLSRDSSKTDPTIQSRGPLIPLSFIALEAAPGETYLPTVT